MALTRLPNWQALLAAQIEKARSASFQWGTFDCGLAACDAIAAITGEDPGAGYRGRYTTQAEAEALIGNDLGKFAAGIAAAIGAPEVPNGFGRRGDVVLVDNSGFAGAGVRGASGESVAGARWRSLFSTALGFVDLSGRFALCASEQGLVRVPMRRWIRAWQIG